MRLRVDVGQLATLAPAVGSLAARFTESTALLTVARAATPGVAAAPLAAAVRRRDHAAEQLRALRVVLRVVAEAYAATEAGVAALWSATSTTATAAAPAPDAGLRSLLGRADPAGLEALLVAVPGLAAAVARGEGGPRGAGTGLGADLGVGHSARTELADVRLRDELTRTQLLSAGAAAREQQRLLTPLDPARRRRFALLNPRLMGWLTAAPPDDRYAASRVLVAADLAGLLARRPAARGTARDALDERIALRQRLLGDQVVLHHPDGTSTRRPHQLLRFDPAGDGGLVEVLGDLRRARHVAVFVPGTGSDLRRYPGSLGRMVPFASADPSLAVVLWQGADHPDQPFDDPLDPASLLPPHDLTDGLRDYARRHVVAAAYRDAADLAGPVLATDVAGLRVAAGTRDLTVLGHSYGGSIVGAAEVGGMVADRIVHVASAGAYVSDVSGYADPTGPQRFSMTAPDDPIQMSQGHSAADASEALDELLPGGIDPLAPVVAPLAADALGGSEQIGHGLDPDEVPGVVRLDTGVHADGSLVRGHSGMFDPGDGPPGMPAPSTAWRNLLAVMVGGRVEVLEPRLWASHLEPLAAQVTGPPGVAGLGGLSVRVRAPHYVVDRSPYDAPGYRPPLLDMPVAPPPAPPRSSR